MWYDELGLAVDKAWAQVDRSIAELPRIAADLLRDVSLQSIDAIELAKTLVSDHRIPQQLPVPFGDAQITAWRGDKLLVQLVYWLDNTTEIHPHGFAGAFRILEGASLHSTYMFQAHRSIDAKLQFGHLERVGREQLEKGEVREITPSLIHNLNHLVFPSVTIVVRTPFNPTLSPQFQYYPPGLAVAPHVINPDVRAQLRLLQVVFRADPSGARRAMENLIARGLSTAWEYLQMFGHTASGRAQLGQDLRSIRRVHGSDGSFLVEAFLQQRLRLHVFRARAQIRDRAARTLLALLADGGGRRSIIHCLSELFPDAPPLERLEAWLVEVSKPLGIALDPAGAHIVAKHMAGKSPKEIASELTAVSEADVWRLVGSLRRSALSPLFL